jgi:putative phage-type endonuclease
MNVTSLKDMTREQWLAWRRKGIGSSDAASIMGHSPWRTPYQTWEDKVFGEQQPDNPAMQRGRDYEEAARQCYMRKTGLVVKPRNLEHPTHPWIKASFDGITDDGKRAVEIKVPGRADHLLASTNVISPKYVIQMQHQFQVVVNLEVNEYFSYDPILDDGYIIPQTRDSSFINNELFPKEKDFWEMVLSQVPPPLTAKDYCEMTHNPRWQHLTNRLREVSRFVKEVEDIKEEMKQIAEGRNCKGGGIELTKSVCKGTIDYKRAFEDHNIPLDNYRKESYIKWTLRGI